MRPICLSIFLLSLFLCVATYFLYPLAVYVIARFFPVHFRKEDNSPSVSLIISAYNEERDIERKIRNTLDLDYPAGKMEIIIGSDGSTDRTVEVSSRYARDGIKILAFPKNRGKTSVQNDCAGAAQGEILVFSDAASCLNRDAMKNLVRNFSDSRVGCVAGCLRYVNTDRNLTTESQGIYWRYEKKIREWESGRGNLVGVDGPLYAIRREAFVPLQGHVISDLIAPLLVRASGRKVVLEEGAVAEEDPTTKSSQEIGTRRRITVRALVGLASHPDLMNPVKYPVLASQIVFHKLIRWFVGPLVVMNFASCLLLVRHGALFRVVLAAYFLLILSSGIGLVLERFHRKLKWFSIPYYFFLVNYAATLGIFDFVRKRNPISWQPVRQP